MAARWLRASKDGTPLRFVPVFAPLEDRCVPATYYVDPVLAGSADGATVTFDAGHVRQTAGLVYASSTAFALVHPAATAFSSFRAALDAAAKNADPADAIQLATGSIPLDNSAVTFPVGGGFVNSIPVAQSLTLRGDGAGATTILPTADTQFDDGTGAVPDDLTSLFRVDGAAGDLTASNFRLDGSGHKAGVGFAVQNGAGARFDGVAVTNVVFAPTGTTSGVAVAANAAKFVTFTAGTLAGYGRTGILFFGTPGAVSNSTITGRGTVTSINNGIELQSGSAVSVTGNRIADNNGTVAPADQSSGLLVVDGGAGANPSTALVVGNTFTGNTVALNVGTGLPDSSVLNAAYNTLAGNTFGASGAFALTKQNLANNWWGDASGPFDPATPGGTGDAVEGSGKLGVRPFRSYPTPQLAPAAASSFAAAQADYLRLITTLNVAIDPVGPASLTTAPASVSFTVTFPVGVAANTVEPAALRSLQASDFAVTAPAGATVTLTGAGAAYALTVSGLTGTNFAVTARLPARAAIDPATGRLTAASNAATVAGRVPDPTPPPAVPNAAPTLAGNLPDVNLSDTATTGPIPFTVGDDNTPAAGIDVSVVSSNPAVVPVSSLTLGGTGAARTIAVGGLPGAAGASTITLTARDGNGALATRTFTVTVRHRTRLFAVAADAGGSPEVQVFGVDGKARFRFLAFEGSFTGGVRVATADFNGDLTDDIVVAAGAGGAPRIRVLSGTTGEELANYFAYASDFRGGAFVTTADLTGTGTPSVVTGAGPGGGPHVKAFALAGTTLQSFFAFDPAFTGGVTVAAGDLDGDGKDEIVIGAGPGGGPRVSAFSFAATGPKITQTYFAFDPAFRGGVFVTAGTFGIAAAAGVGGTPEVRVKSGTTIVAYEAAVTGGVRLGAIDLNGDGLDEILVAAGPGGGSRVQAFTAAGTPAHNAFAFDTVARPGYFIG